MTEDKQDPADLLNVRRAEMMEERILAQRMQTDAIAGELIDRGAVQKIIVDMITRARMLLLAVPAKTASVIADVLHTETEEVLPILRSEILRVLNELSIDEEEADDAVTRTIRASILEVEQLSDGATASHSVRRRTRRAPRKQTVGQDDRGPAEDGAGSATPAKRAVRNIKNRRAATAARRRKRSQGSSS